MSLKIPHKPSPPLARDKVCYQYIPKGKKKCIKNIFEEKNVFQASTLAEQIYLPMDPRTASGNKKI